jgi:hypothetical protein
MSTGTKTSLTATSELLIPAMITERVSETARHGSKLGLVINNADNELMHTLMPSRCISEKLRATLSLMIRSISPAS